MSIAQKIKLLREQKGLTQEELARMIHTTKQSIYKYENGIVTNIPLEKIEQIAKVLETTPAWLMGWADQSTQGDQIPGAASYQPNVRIPVLGRISAGLPLYAEQNIEGYMSIELPDDGEYFALIARGDSMDALGIKDGYTLIVRRQTAVDNGDVAVVLVDGQDATVKRVYVQGDQVTLMPQSSNPMHLPQIYSAANDDIRIQGKVMKVFFNL